MADYIASIRAILDTKNLNTQITSLENRTITLNRLTVDTNSLAAEIQRALNSHNFSISNVTIPNIAREMQMQGQSAGSQFAQSFNVGMAEIRTTARNSADSINNIQEVLRRMNFNNSAIQTITRDFENMNLAIRKITTSVNGEHIALNVTGVDEFGRVVNMVRSITPDLETGELMFNDFGNKITQTFNTGEQAAKRFRTTLTEANQAMSSGGIEASITGVQAKFEQLGITGHSRLTVIETDINELISLQNIMSTTTDNNTLVQSYNRFNDILARVQNNLKVVSNYSKQFASATEVNALEAKINKWLTTNTKGTKQYGAQLRQYIATLQNMNATGNRSRSVLNQIANGFRQVDIEAEKAGLKGKSFIDKFKSSFSVVSRYISSATLIYAGIRQIKQGINSVVELDTALVDLKKTTNGTEQQLRSFYYTANDTAKQLGVSTKDVIQAAADWSRLGYSIKDAEKMAEVSSIFKSISPGMDMEKATDGLVSVMKAFNIEANDALDGIASKINIIGNTQAVSNDDIVEFLTRSSSAMSEANNTLEDTIALGTAAVEITRDAASVGKKCCRQ